MMDNIEILLRLMEEKARHYWGSSFTYAQTHYEERYEGTPSPIAREELYDAKCEALREFIADIRACIPTTSAQMRNAAKESSEERYAFITEMAGTMTATIYNTYPELKAASARFDKDHEDYFRDNANAKCAWNHVTIKARHKIPRAGALSNGVLDVRLVLITEIDGDLNAIVCDTEEDLQREIAGFKQQWDDWIRDQDAVWSSHEILIPPLLAAQDDVPF